MGLRNSSLRLHSGASLGRGSVSSAWAGTWLRGEAPARVLPTPRAAADDAAAGSGAAEAVPHPVAPTPAATAPGAVPASRAGVPDAESAAGPLPDGVPAAEVVPGSCLEHLRALTATDSLTAAADALRAVVADATGADRVGVWLLEAGGSALAPAGTDIAGEPPRIALGSGLVGRCAAQCRPVSGRTTGSRGSAGGATPRTGDGDDPSVVTFAHAAVPLRAGGRVIGVLDAAWDVDLSPEPGAEVEDQQAAALATLELAAAVAGAQLEMLRLRELDAVGLERDPETGLLHQGRLRGDLAQECARTRRYGQPFSLLLVAVDAAEGAMLGPDAPLAVAADLVHAHVRASDAVYRFGADAVAVLAPHTGAEGATSLAARLSGVLDRRFAPAPDEPDAAPAAHVRWAWVTVPDVGDAADDVLAQVCARLDLPAA